MFSILISSCVQRRRVYVWWWSRKTLGKNIKISTLIELKVCNCKKNPSKFSRRQFWHFNLYISALHSSEQKVWLSRWLRRWIWWGELWCVVSLSPRQDTNRYICFKTHLRLLWIRLKNCLWWIWLLLYFLLYIGRSKGRGPRDMHPFWIQFFFQFHAVLGGKCQNNRLAPPPLGWCSLWEILDQPQMYCRIPVRLYCMNF